jgi:heme A synthase
MHDLHYLSGVILFAAVFGYVVYLALRKKRATKPTSSYHFWVQYFGYGVTISALITGGNLIG